MTNIGKIVKQQRAMSGLTLRQLSDKSGVSQSYLSRIERGERCPSALILRNIAQPLRFDESELLVLAGYLSPHSTSDGNSQLQDSLSGLDPHVARVLSQESVELQRMVVAILTILKSIARI